MRRVDKGGGGQVFFTYDASGQRVRKVWEHGIVEERIYRIRSVRPVRDKVA